MGYYSRTKQFTLDSEHNNNNNNFIGLPKLQAYISTSSYKYTYRNYVTLRNSSSLQADYFYPNELMVKVRLYNKE